MSLKAYKFRIYPDDEQQLQLSKTFGCCRFVYNNCLAKKIEIYKEEEKGLSKLDCNNYVNRELKTTYEWLRDIDKFALTNAVYNLDTAYQNFFREMKKGNNNQGFPKFKSKYDNNQSYTTNFTNNNIEVNFIDNKIKLPKLKWIKSKVHNSFKGQIKSATISKTPSNEYFVSILVEQEIKYLEIHDNKIGFDLGIKEFIVTSNGEYIENPKVLRQYEEKLKKEQRKLSKKQNRSKNYGKKIR